MAEPIKYESVLPQLLTTLLGNKIGGSGLTTTTNSGSTQTEVNSADTEALRTVFGQQNAMNTPEGMKAVLAELFNKGAMEVPGLTQAYANASGTRTTGNSGLQLALGELNKQLAGKAGELLQANMANSAQTGNAIANATKSMVGTKGPSTTTVAASENKTTGANTSNALLLGLLGSAANMADKKGLFGKLGSKLGFSDGPTDFSNNFSNSGGVLDQNALSANYDSYDFQGPAAGFDAGASTAGLDFGSSATSSLSDLANGLDFGSLGTEAAAAFGSDFGDLADFGTDFASDAATDGFSDAAANAGDFIDFGEFFADGGLVDTASIRGAHKASMESKLTKQMPSGSNSTRAPGYADGGTVDTSVVRNRNNMGAPIPRQGSNAINFDPSSLAAATTAGAPSLPAAHLQAILKNRSKPTTDSLDSNMDGGGSGGVGGNSGATAVDAQGGFNALLGSLAGAAFGLVGSIGAKAMGATSMQAQAMQAATQALGLTGGGGGTAGFGGSDASGFAGSNASGSGMGYDGSGDTLGIGAAGLDGDTGESTSGGSFGDIGDISGFSGADTGGFGGDMGGSGGSGGSGDNGSDNGGGGGMGGSGEGGGGFGGVADGGKIDGPGNGTSDSIHARLSDGEFVMSADVVNHLGSDFFQKLQDTFHVPAAQQRMSR